MSQQAILNIEIDDREHKIKNYINYHKYTYNTYEVKRLKVGDFIISVCHADGVNNTADADNAIIIERKTLKDLSSSIKDKRLYNQIRNLKLQNKKFCFIIEGNVKDYCNLQKKVIIIYYQLNI